MSAAEFSLIANGYDPSTNADTEAYADGPTKTRNIIQKRMLPGTGNDQQDHLWAEDTADAGTAQLAASGTRSVDLQTETDARGNALGLDDVAMLLITHKAESAASSLHLAANAANGWTNLLGTLADFKIVPGMTIVLLVPTAGALAVTGTNKVLDIVNDDGANAADYRIEVWGR
jgi:hypothetical protein